MAVARAIPAVTADSSLIVATPTRTGPYGEAYTLLLGGDLGQFADEGSFYIVQTTTPGTGVAGHAAPVAADLSTKPLIHCYNGGTGILVPKYIKVRLTAIGAGATTTDADVWLETGGGATSRASGGTLMSPSINTKSNVTTADNVVCYFGPVVSTLTSAKRTGHSRIRSVVPVVEDQYTIVFGDMAVGPNAGVATTGTNQALVVVPMAPVAIAPTNNFQFHIWGVSQSGAHSFDLELGYVYR